MVRVVKSVFYSQFQELYDILGVEPSKGAYPYAYLKEKYNNLEGKSGSDTHLLKLALQVLSDPYLKDLYDEVGTKDIEPQVELHLPQCNIEMAHLGARTTCKIPKKIRVDYFVSLDLKDAWQSELIVPIEGPEDINFNVTRPVGVWKGSGSQEVTIEVDKYEFHVTFKLEGLREGKIIYNENEWNIDRNGNLSLTREIKLSEFLKLSVIRVDLLDGSTIEINKDEIKNEITRESLGMLKIDGTRGNLIVKFNAKSTIDEYVEFLKKEEGRERMVSDLEHKIEDCKDELQIKSEETERMRSDSEKAKSQLEKANSELKKIRDENTKYLQDYVRVKEQGIEDKKKYDQCRQELDQCRQELEKCRKECQTSQGAKEEFEKTYSAKLRDYEECRRQLDTYRRENEDQKRRLESCQGDIKNYETMLKLKTDEALEYHNEIQKLTSELSRFTASRSRPGSTATRR